MRIIGFYLGLGLMVVGTILALPGAVIEDIGTIIAKSCRGNA